MSNDKNRLHFLTEGESDEGWMDWEYTDMDGLTKSFLEKPDVLRIFIWHCYGDQNIIPITEWLENYRSTDLISLVRMYATDLIEYHLHIENYETCGAIKKHAVSLINDFEKDNEYL